MSDTSGRLFEMPWAVWHPASSSWRTYAGTSHSGSRKFSGTWPTSGSMRDGACYEHPTWEHPTSVPASSSLLGTPTSHPRTHGPRDVDHGIALANQVALLPTPRSNEANGTGDHGTGGRDLRTEVSLLPTPRATRGGSATETAQLLPTPTVQASKVAAPTPYERERYEAGGSDAYNLCGW